MAKPPRQRNTAVAQQKPANPPTQRTAVSVSQAEFHSGPLPPPRAVREYEDIYPGASEIIFNAFQEQGRHRMAMETYVAHEANKRSNRGLWVGAGVSVVAIAGAVTLGYFGQPVPATALGSTTVVALATCFVTGTVAQHQERKDRLAQVIRR